MQDGYEDLCKPNYMLLVNCQGFARLYKVDHKTNIFNKDSIEIPTKNVIVITVWLYISLHQISSIYSVTILALICSISFCFLSADLYKQK